VQESTARPSLAWVDAARSEAIRAVRQRFGTGAPRITLLGFDEVLGAQAEGILEATLRRSAFALQRFSALRVDHVDDKTCLLLVATGCGSECLDTALSLGEAHQDTDVAVVCVGPPPQCLQRARHRGIRSVMRATNLGEELPPAARAAIHRRQWIVEAQIQDEIDARIVRTFGFEAAIATGACVPMPVRPTSLVDQERASIQDALLVAKGNKTHAAAWLGIPRTTLLSRIRALDIAMPSISETRARARVWWRYSQSDNPNSEG